MAELIASLEQSGLGVTVRESLWVYPTLLTLHAVGLAFLVGVSLLVDLRVLGVAGDLPFEPLRRFAPVFYAGFVINAFSGLGLLAGEATKMLNDPVFYTKMGCIAVAVVFGVARNRRIFRQAVGATASIDGARLFSALSLAAWAGAIIAGRLTAYGFFRS